MLGLFAMKRPIHGRIAGLFVFQVGMDVIFLGVIGYAIVLLSDVTGWLSVVIVVAPVLAIAAAAWVLGWRK
jgi:hypothetical protein